MSDFWNSAEPRGSYREVSAAQLTSAPSVRIVDVREPGEFNAELGHIPGAELVPMGQFPTAAEGWNKDEVVLLVCRSGNRSGQVAGFLASQGFSKLINLGGGMMAYGTNGLPVERSSTESNP